MKRDALVSPDGTYRYWLTRDWTDEDPWIPSDGRQVLWVMLNPSTADADVDDPTIRRCISFSARWGYRRLMVVNLFAYRATDPEELRTKAWDPIGPENQMHVDQAIAASDRVVCAWGAFLKKMLYRPRISVVKPARSRGIELGTLGMTKEGYPRHPLYVPYTQDFEVAPAIKAG